MRLIGHLRSETSARTFGDYLYSRHIENHIELEKDGAWAVWISDEDKIPEAAAILKEFEAAPGDAKYHSGAKQAAQRKADEARKEQEYRKRVRDVSSVRRPLAEYGFGPVCVSLMVISAAIFILTRFGDQLETVRWLFMSEYHESKLMEVRQGQIWRLFTPIFVHMDALHILFNLLWLRDLGGAVEIRHGSRRLLFMVLALALVSNLVQYIFVGPNFGGMSGVVYGLLGYVWLRGRFDPGSGFFLHQITVVMMVGWLFLGLAGVMNMANGAHLGGLIMGMAWGYLAAMRAP